MPEQPLRIQLPDWAEAMAPAGACIPDREGRVRLAIALADANVAHGGGPFGAVVFERTSGRLVAAGVNRVLAEGLSVAHAEVVAMSLAQQRLGSFDLSAVGDYELVTSAEPCVQCFGALFWSGVKGVVCAARSPDAEAVGFDEGPKPGDWAQLLNARGIAVTTDVLRQEAAAVLRQYAALGGTIYNPGQPHP